MTTLVEDTERSMDSTFRMQVRAIIARELPDIIGEGPAGFFPRATTETQRAKRHAWAMEVLRDIAQNGAWLDRVCWLLAGEAQVQNVPIGAPVADNILTGRFRAILNDLAGVQNGE